MGHPTSAGCREQRNIAPRAKRRGSLELNLAAGKLGWCKQAAACARLKESPEARFNTLSTSGPFSGPLSCAFSGPFLSWQYRHSNSPYQESLCGPFLGPFLGLLKILWNGGTSEGTDKERLICAVIGARMSHWKWRETKLQPS